MPLNNETYIKISKNIVVTKTKQLSGRNWELHKNDPIFNDKCISMNLCLSSLDKLIDDTDRCIDDKFIDFLIRICNNYMLHKNTYLPHNIGITLDWVNHVRNL